MTHHVLNGMQQKAKESQEGELLNQMQKKNGTNQGRKNLHKKQRKQTRRNKWKRRRLRWNR